MIMCDNYYYVNLWCVLSMTRKFQLLLQVNIIKSRWDWSRLKKNLPKNKNRKVVIMLVGKNHSKTSSSLLNSLKQ